MTREASDRIIREQLALELNCAPEDFSREETVITLPVLHEKRRMFSQKPFFLQMATFGGNAVISAAEELHPWLRAWVKGKEGFWLFEQHNYYELERELRKYGYKMAQTHHMFLPTQELTGAETDLSVRWLEPGDIAPFYGRAEFSNALCDRFRPERPDVLAVVALDGAEIMGMAGCSADTPALWQIGIDVLPAYRGRGIGKALVSLLRQEALRRGALPYYGTSLSNIRSWRTALASGFLPAWVETEAREAEDGSFAK
jgi:GNAT superfamily N-acetyltransferase